MPREKPAWAWETRRPNEQTPDYLGRVLDEYLDFPRMAAKARAAHYDDFHAPAEVADGMEILRLYNDLRAQLDHPLRAGYRERVLAVMEAVKAGEFDATKAESDRWAASKDGQDAMRALLGEDR